MDGPSSNTRPGNGGQGETSSREGREQTRRPTKMKRQRGGPPVRVACAECRRCVCLGFLSSIFLVMPLIEPGT